MKILLFTILLIGLIENAFAGAPRLPLALGGQFEVSTDMGDSHYTISPFISGYMDKLGHLKLGAMVESFDQMATENIRYSTKETRLFAQIGVDLVVLGGSSYIYYKISNNKLESDASAGDSDWVTNHSIGLGAQHQLDPFFGITAELEYFWNKKSINHAAPTESPLSQSVIQINIGILFFIY